MKIEKECVVGGNEESGRKVRREENCGWYGKQILKNENQFNACISMNSSFSIFFDNVKEQN